MSWHGGGRRVKKKYTRNVLVGVKTWTKWWEIFDDIWDVSASLSSDQLEMNMEIAESSAYWNRLIEVVPGRWLIQGVGKTGDRIVPLCTLKLPGNVPIAFWLSNILIFFGVLVIDSLTKRESCDCNSPIRGENRLLGHWFLDNPGKPKSYVSRYHWNKNKIN